MVRPITGQPPEERSAFQILEKGKEFIRRWCDKVDQLWAGGCYLRAILTLLLPYVALGLIIVFLIMMFTAIFDFFRRYYTQLIAVAFGICLFVAWLDKRKTEEIKRKREEQEIRERQDYSDRLEVARTKDATYKTQAKILFSVVRELGPLGIVPPATLSNIFSPGRTILKGDGTVSINLYLLQKDLESVDTDLLKNTLQTKIDQRLQAGEFPGIPEQHVYRGRVYSGFVIDMVRDNVGGFVEVYTVLVDDSYCRYRANLELNEYRLLPSIDRRDTDY